MSTLTLPLDGTLDTDGILFAITQSGPSGGSGGIAIFGESYGTDRVGDGGIGVQGVSDAGTGVSAISKDGQQWIRSRRIC